ncbi:hypothetical protein [Rudaea sp.]|uniref:hypothetical protein n=1 Tax=Rudaea sp. TaxID=2136325 RepID=UPI0032200CE9
MLLRYLKTGDARRIALIYQQVPPPVFDGVRKAPKPGGYADSGADIAWCLRRAGTDVVTPSADPDPAANFDWVFPDTQAGIQSAIDRGATVIWANTVLFSGHPLESRLEDVWVVGQMPARQQRVDDKFATNAALCAQGLPVAASVLVAREARGSIRAFASLTAPALAELGLHFPLVVKPVRGRGSQGVSRVADHGELAAALSALLAGGTFGDVAIVEEYLPGEELTLTVLPALPDEGGASAPFVLPPVRRFNHADGIAPYNGVVAVTRNSAALALAESDSLPVRAIMDACARSAELVGALAPIRIDCRADATGVQRIFDVNMKPNMTGAGRPGREDQDSLSTIAARALGWSFTDLLTAMLRNAWRIERGRRPG